MKKILLFALILFIAGSVFAQQEIGTPDPQTIGIESAHEMVREVSIDKFEHDGFWRSAMSSDEGYTTTRLFRGSPAGKKPLDQEENLNIPDEYVLGTRVDFLRRGYSSFFILPTRPIPIEGITKMITVWVAGRSFNHRLFILIQDYNGRQMEFLMRQDGGPGTLNFSGWQRMFAVIEPEEGDGTRGVIQRSRNTQNHFGIRIVGFRIDCDPIETRGSYYIYLDDLRAYTDLTSEHLRNPDDMIDGW